MIFEAEQAVNLVDKPYYALDFGSNLLGSHKYMRVVLSKTANASETAQFARLFKTMNVSKLGETQGQLTVATRFRFINHHM